MERGFVAAFKAEDMHFLFSLLFDELYEVTEVTIASKECKLCELVEI